MQIKFSHNSPLDWSDPGEGVQIYSEEITEDGQIVAVLPHPMSSPDVASPAYYYFKSISAGREIPPSEVASDIKMAQTIVHSAAPQTLY